MAIIHFISLVRKLSILASGFRVQYARRRSFEEISFDAETMGKHFKYQHIIPYKTLLHLYAFNFFLNYYLFSYIYGYQWEQSWHEVDHWWLAAPRARPRDETPCRKETQDISARAGARRGSPFSGLTCIQWPCIPASAFAIPFYIIIS